MDLPNEQRGLYRGANLELRHKQQYGGKYGNIDKSFDLVLNTLNILIDKLVPIKFLKCKKTYHLLNLG